MRKQKIINSSNEGKISRDRPEENKYMNELMDRVAGYTSTNVHKASVPHPRTCGRQKRIIT